MQKRKCHTWSIQGVAQASSTAVGSTGTLPLTSESLGCSQLCLWSCSLLRTSLEAAGNGSVPGSLYPHRNPGGAPRSHPNSDCGECLGEGASRWGPSLLTPSQSNWWKHENKHAEPVFTFIFCIEEKVLKIIILRCQGLWRGKKVSNALTVSSQLMMPSQISKFAFYSLSNANSVTPTPHLNFPML